MDSPYLAAGEHPSFLQSQSKHCSSLSEVENDNLRDRRASVDPVQSRPESIVPQNRQLSRMCVGGRGHFFRERRSPVPNVGG